MVSKSKKKVLMVLPDHHALPDLSPIEEDSSMKDDGSGLPLRWSWRQNQRRVSSMKSNKNFKDWNWTKAMMTTDEDSEDVPGATVSSEMPSDGTSNVTRKYLHPIPSNVVTRSLSESTITTNDSTPSEELKKENLKLKKRIQMMERAKLKKEKEVLKLEKKIQMMERAELKKEKEVLKLEKRIQMMERAELNKEKEVLKLEKRIQMMERAELKKENLELEKRIQMMERVGMAIFVSVVMVVFCVSRAKNGK